MEVRPGKRREGDSGDQCTAGAGPMCTRSQMHVRHGATGLRGHCGVGSAEQRCNGVQVGIGWG